MAFYKFCHGRQEHNCIMKITSIIHQNKVISFCIHMYILETTSIYIMHKSCCKKTNLKPLDLSQTISCDSTGHISVWIFSEFYRLNHLICLLF